MSHIAFPLQFDSRGHTARGGRARQVADLLEQVLFTAPGERVMRPDFGSGVRQLVFAPASQPLAISTEMTVSAAVTEHLGDLVAVDKVAVELGDGRITIDVVFTLRDTGEQRAVQLEGPAP